MPRLRRSAIVFTLLALVAVACTTSPSSTSTPQSEPAGENARAGSEEEPRVGGELEHEAQELQERIEAFESAKAAGTAGITEPVITNAAPGWAGESVVDPKTDDWEPAIAADPNGPFVYLLVTRIGEPKPCPGNCPTAFIGLRRSTDRGKTWTKVVPLCACKGSWQYDPMIEVVPNTGDVYAAYLNGFNVVFLKSTDHGKTWTDPAPVYGNVSWNDKPALAMNDNGRDVYISFNGPTGGDPWIAQSHDRGRTWTQKRLVNSKVYYFAFDADVLHDGTVIFSESGITYTAPGAAAEGHVRQVAFISRDDGRRWSRVLIDSVKVGEPCVAPGCSSDFYIGHNAVSADDRDHLVYLYDGASTELGPQRIYARTSRDEGATWSKRIALSVHGENATSPAVESTGNGDVRAWYMQTADGDDRNAWNVWYRSSRDGGTTWSAPVKISDAISGARYKTADGFSWIGPGGVWVNRQL